MSRLRRARTWILVLLGAAAAVLAGIVVGAGDPDLVWLPAGPDADFGDFRRTPDGEPVPHAATMQDNDGAWAYYYRPPNRFRDWTQSLGIGPDPAVAFLATGRTVTTASGDWREYRRCTNAEMMSSIPLRRGGPSSND